MNARRNIISIILLIFIPFFGISQSNTNYVIVIHGGAGTITRAGMTPEKEAAYKAGIAKALETGYQILKNGGTALDAVTDAVKTLEDNPLFNAGKGAVFTNAGTNEMDAAIMTGKTLAAGSIAGVTNLKNPITAARVVMEKSPHVMMTGKGAEQFAASQGCTVVDPSYFFTDNRWNALQKVIKEDSIKAELEKFQKPKKQVLLADSMTQMPQAYQESYDYHISKYGTVGAVALDQAGNLAAATSTGGMTNKKWGRVGDAPIIGAGTYADNNSCAVSCTGYGEYFIRAVVAKSIADQVKYARLPLATAALNALNEVKRLGGDGGLIAVDNKGNITMPFNSEGMYRGFLKKDGTMVIEIYRD